MLKGSSSPQTKSTIRETASRFSTRETERFHVNARPATTMEAGAKVSAASHPQFANIKTVAIAHTDETIRFSGTRRCFHDTVAKYAATTLRTAHSHHVASARVNSSVPFPEIV